MKDYLIHKIYTPMKYNKEFFISLKEKIYKSLESFYNNKTLDKTRLKLLNEILENLNIYKGILQKSIYKTITKSDIQKVEIFGEKNGYPAMILNRNNNKIIKYLGQGEDKWREAIAWPKLKKPYSDNFLDLIIAIEENEIIEEEK